MLSGFVGVRIGRANRMEGGWSVTLSLIPFKERIYATARQFRSMQ